MNLLFDTAMLGFGLGISFLGCALLALSQSRNWRKVSGDSKTDPLRSVRAGWALVMLALLPCVLRDGGSFAALLWPLLFACGAMTTALLLTYKPQWLRPLARISQAPRR